MLPPNEGQQEGSPGTRGAGGYQRSDFPISAQKPREAAGLPATRHLTYISREAPGGVGALKARSADALQTGATESFHLIAAATP